MSSSTTPARSKRVTGSAACQRCRQRKVKCDGERPCAHCARAGVQCIWLTKRNETQREANARQATIATQEATQLTNLFSAIAGEPNDAVALEAFHLIRRGRSPGTVLAHLNGALTDNALYGSYHAQRQTAFLRSLVFSTAGFGDVAFWLTQAFGHEASFQLPSNHHYKQFNGAIVTIGMLERILKSVNEQQPLAATAQDGDTTSYDNEPPYAVPAHPWTSMLQSDLQASQLVSVYLVLLNPIWRFVEEDLFLEAMRRKDLDSTYCSRLLVHAVLAISSLYCEYDVAFQNPGDYYSRGKHFLKEGLAIWASSDGQPSISNAQALLLLSYTTTILGNGTQGLDLMYNAIELSRSLPDIPQSSFTPINLSDRRARLGVFQAGAFLELLTTTAYKRPSTFKVSMFTTNPSLSMLSSDDEAVWRPYPYSKHEYKYNKPMFARCREDIMLFLLELNEFCLKHGTSGTPEANISAWSITTRWEAWHHKLSKPMQYHRDQPSMIYELHCTYAAYQLQLYDVAQDHLPLVGPGGARHKEHSHAVALAQFVATMARDYRMKFGAKRLPNLFILALSPASFRLLIDIRLRPNATSAKTETPDQPIKDSSTALEECFRCLLAFSLQQALPFQIARTVYNSALDLRLHLPANLVKILSLLIKPVLRSLSEPTVESLLPQATHLMDSTADQAASLLTRMIDEVPEA